MSPIQESSLILVLRELCLNPAMKSKLRLAFEDELAEEEKKAVSAAKAALYDDGKRAMACALNGRAMYIAELLETINQM